MSNETINLADSVIAQTYKRFPMVMTQGKGVMLYDSDERAYTDFTAGIAVCNLGHANSKVADAICEQAAKLIHVSNLYYTLPQTELAKVLVAKSFADRVFFCNSGAEANEAAIKLVRRYFYEKGETEKIQIISMKKSFHGRTMAALSATGQEKIRKGFDPVLSGFDFVPFGDIDAVKNAIGPETGAVMLEPIQGEGGVCCTDKNYFKALRKICDENGILLILDEIQTGMGRTGKFFAYEHFGIEPDIMTLAKALANGLPVGAMLAKEEFAKAFSPGVHASTFGGTPLVCAAALEVVRILTEEGIVEQCETTGQYFKEKLLWLKERHDAIEDVRGMGLLLGMGLNINGGRIVEQCMEKGFLINCIQDKVLRFIPPLIIETEAIDRLVSCLDDIFLKERAVK
ncbi:aspartate aminotransferase family protein [Desulfobacterales bacterium HSG16]|nr:aspartate aminotransferase family protein [Desulfobacterales bacterium HSG16]